MGKVSLAGITQSVVPGVQTPAQFLAYCARVSSTANQFNHASGPKLLRFLVKRKEWSPLEMVNLVITVETERDVARQILRHGFRFQEFSQRYAMVLLAFSFRRARMQDHKDRQSSIVTDDAIIQFGWSFGQWLVSIVCGLVYRTALRCGVAKEVARVVLPEGMTPTRMHINGTLRNWLHYVQLRCKKETQLEHREIAFQIADILKQKFPDISDEIPMREDQK